jgi:hypothetical protein
MHSHKEGKYGREQPKTLAAVKVRLAHAVARVALSNGSD